MKTSNIPAINALSRVRTYCEEQMEIPDGLANGMLGSLGHPKKMKKADRSDYDELRGTAIGYHDTMRQIEALMIEVVEEE